MCVGSVLADGVTSQLVNQPDEASLGNVGSTSGSGSTHAESASALSEAVSTGSKVLAVAICTQW